MENGDHILQSYDQELEEIRSKALEMGGLVEKQVSNALQAVLERDVELGEHVASSDADINELEVEIDEECASIIARRQPAAGDLRLLLSIIKITTDLERIGDEAEQIGLYASQLGNHVSNQGMSAQLRHLGELAHSLLKLALDAFARMDDEQAMDVAKKSRRVSREFDDLSRILITHMMDDTRNIKNALRVIWCARAFERIGNHSTNICEFVIYRVKGKDIRHTSLKKIRKKLYPETLKDKKSDDE
ncbi:phosphate signaling complex protein PhoU [Leucothrix pacifica]|uniref:Phosphate-specific transport system accessory protein PhoU n=1 Tax=Leucothrix pacifica TaxID=1247513 RepID=A0A317C3J6_9GAMM|nr:phosphate signaling complex protein PhoU [Leucothrix pacifica]PWQ92849.1 phosphate transport system regulatory protein PhoU [Leucothrix pacifica]